MSFHKTMRKLPVAFCASMHARVDSVESLGMRVAGSVLLKRRYIAQKLRGIYACMESSALAVRDIWSGSLDKAMILRHTVFAALLR